MAYLMLNAGIAIWMYFDGTRRRCAVVPWCALTIPLAAIAVPAYSAVRPLRKGEFRSGGVAWNALKSFVIVWTATIVAIALGRIVSRLFFDAGAAEMYDAEPAAAQSLGLGMLYLAWLLPAVGALILGFVLKNPSTIEQGPAPSIGDDETIVHVPNWRALPSGTREVFRAFAANLGAAASLGARQAEKTTVATISLPNLYRSLGKEAHRRGAFRDSFPRLHAQLDELTRVGESLRNEAATKPLNDLIASAEATIRRATNLAKGKSLEVRARSIREDLGRAVFERDTTDAALPEWTKPIAECRSRLDMLDLDIKKIGEAEWGWLLTPKRVAIVGVAAAIMLFILALSSIVNSGVGGRAADHERAIAQPANRGTVAKHSEDKGALVLSLDLERDIAGAVGFVVCGSSVFRGDGISYEVPRLPEGEDFKLADTGTGFAVSSQGHVLTNKHVVARVAAAMQAKSLLSRVERETGLKIEPKIWIFFGTHKYDADIIYISQDNDFAILKVSRTGGHFFCLASNDVVPRGTGVVVVGFPAVARTPLSDEEERSVQEQLDAGPTAHIESLFKNRDFQYVESRGTVSRVVREKEGRTWIQHNANLNPGNSGGPLVGPRAIVYGINTLHAPDASGISMSLGIAQLRQEIDRYVPDVVWDGP